MPPASRRKSRRPSPPRSTRKPSTSSCSTNSRQVQALADGIEQALSKEGTKPSLVEGRSHAEWILIDYFDFIVHIFTPATRDFYALERLWGDAQRVEIPA